MTLCNSCNLLSLPRHVLEGVFSYLTYDEVAKARETCTLFDEVCSGILNQGFRKLERQVAARQIAIRAKLPRRESERRSHPLSRHCEVLSAMETRLSLLKMSIMRYVDEGRCCFFAGKVLDEIDRVCRSVQATNDIPLRPYELLHELRDISSMAVEHFEDVLLPIIQRKVTSAAIFDVTWNSAPSTSSSLPSLVPTTTVHTPVEDLRAAALCRARQRYSLGASILPSSHCSDLEERVKCLEKAQAMNRSRFGMSLRAISQLFIRLRETTEQNKRLEGLVTAQSRKIQQLESLWSRTTPCVGNAVVPCTAVDLVSSETTSTENTTDLRKRPHASLPDESFNDRQLRSQALPETSKRSRKI